MPHTTENLTQSLESHIQQKISLLNHLQHHLQFSEYKVSLLTDTR